jgi:hypothetical protein
VILIIGGMGFIGQNTALRLLEVGETVVVSQHTSHRIPDLLEAEIGTRAFTARLDVSNPYEVFDVVCRHQVDSIINLMAPPARSVSTQADYHLYTTGLLNVLQAAQTFGLRRVSLGSSVGVYNGLPAGPFREDMALPVDSATQVSAFKKAMEIHALHFAVQAKVDVVALRRCPARAAPPSSRVERPTPRPIPPRISRASRWSSATSPSTRWRRASPPTSSGCGRTLRSGEPSAPAQRLDRRLRLVLDERFAQLLRLLEPVGAARQDHAA